MGILAVLLASILWGTTGLTAHYAPAGSSPFAIGAGSMGLGGLVLFAVSLRRGVVRPAWRPMRRPLGAGVACLVLYPLCFYGAMHDAGVALGTAITIGSSPVMAMGIEGVTLRRRVGAGQVAAAAIAIAGLVLVTLGSSSGDAPRPGVGVVLGLLAGLTYAGYTAAAQRMIASGWPSTVAIGRMFGVASVLLVPFFLIAGGPLLTHHSGWAVMGYLALVPMGLAYVLFGAGLGSVLASAAVTVSLVEPAVASVLAVAVIGEHIAATGWAGLVLVLVGVLVLGLSHTSSERSGRSPAGT